MLDDEELQTSSGNVVNEQTLEAAKNNLEELDDDDDDDDDDDYDKGYCSALDSDDGVAAVGQEHKEEEELEEFMLETPAIEDDVSSLGEEDESESESSCIIEEILEVEEQKGESKFHQSADWESSVELSLDDDSFVYETVAFDEEFEEVTVIDEESEYTDIDVEAYLSSDDDATLEKQKADEKQPTSKKCQEHEETEPSSSLSTKMQDLANHDGLPAARLEDDFPIPAFFGDSQKKRVVSQLRDDGDEKSKAGISFCGRKTEFQRMSAAFEKTQTQGVDDSRRVVWVYGNAGVGKTTLADEFVRILKTSPKTNDGKEIYICYGCFEEKANAAKPFAAVVRCLSELGLHLLNDSGTWREKLREGLGKEARLLATLVPKIGLFLQMEDSIKLTSFDISTKRLFDRLLLVLRKFLFIVCSNSENNVVMILDDLHWADEDSIELVELLLSTRGLRNFFFLGCHRGVKRNHQLQRLKTKLARLSAADILLENLDYASCCELTHAHLDLLVPRNIFDTKDSVEVLTTFLFEKTSGNPLFIVQLIRFLYDKEIISCSEDHGWKWNHGVTSKNVAVPTNSVDTVTERLKLMSTRAKLACKSAGLLGLKQFHVGTLYQALTVCFRTENGNDKCPIEDVKCLNQVLDSFSSDTIFEKMTHSGYYKFTHDTMRKATLKLLPKEKRKMKLLHFNLASHFFKLKATDSASNPATDGEEMKLLVLAHYDAASENIQSDKGRAMLARLNLELADFAMAKAAFKLATKRLESGVALLDQRTRWKTNHDLSLKLHLSLARCKFCTGLPDEAKTFADIVLANGKSGHDKIGAFELLVWIALAKSDFEEALHIIFAGLENIWNEKPGGDVEQQLAKTNCLLCQKTNADLLTLPKTSHKKATTKLGFFALLAEVSTLRRDYRNQDLAALRMTELTLQYGSSDYAGLAFSLYGICLARRGLHGEAYRFGHLAEMMSKPETKYGGLAIAYHHWATHHWRRPLKQSLDPLSKVSTAAMDSNNVGFLSFGVGAFISNMFVSGSHLHSCDTLFHQFQTYGKTFTPRDTWFATIPYQAVLRLRGESHGLSKIQEGWAKHEQGRATQYDIFLQMVTAVFFQDLNSAEKICSKLLLKPEGVWIFYRAFIEGLIASYLVRSSSGKLRIKYQRKAAKMAEVLGAWAKKGAKQCFHMSSLLDVELRVALDRGSPPTRISYLYNTVINAAANDCFVHHEALANERAGLYFLSIQENSVASKYLARACQLYDRWGAHGKVKFLRAEYPKYLNPNPQPQPIPTGDHHGPFNAGQQRAPHGHRSAVLGRGRGRTARGRGRGRGPERNRKSKAQTSSSTSEPKVENGPNEVGHEDLEAGKSSNNPHRSRGKISKARSSSQTPKRKVKRGPNEEDRVCLESGKRSGFRRSLSWGGKRSPRISSTERKKATTTTTENKKNPSSDHLERLEDETFRDELKEGKRGRGLEVGSPTTPDGSRGKISKARSSSQTPKRKVKRGPNEEGHEGLKAGKRPDFLRSLSWGGKGSRRISSTERKKATTAATTTTEKKKKKKMMKKSSSDQLQQFEDETFSDEPEEGKLGRGLEVGSHNNPNGSRGKISNVRSSSQMRKTKVKKRQNEEVMKTRPGFLRSLSWGGKESSRNTILGGSIDKKRKMKTKNKKMSSSDQLERSEDETFGDTSKEGKEGSPVRGARRAASLGGRRQKEKSTPLEKAKRKIKKKDV